MSIALVFSDLIATATDDSAMVQDARCVSRALAAAALRNASPARALRALRGALRIDGAKAPAFLRGHGLTLTRAAEEALFNAGYSTAAVYARYGAMDRERIDVDYDFSNDADVDFVRKAARKAGIAWGRHDGQPPDCIYLAVWREVEDGWRAYAIEYNERFEDDGDERQQFDETAHFRA